MRPSRLLALSLALALFPAADALAYVGPGAGLGAIGALVAVVGAVLVAVFGVIFLPITMIRKRRKARAQDNGAEEMPKTAGDR